MEGQNKILQSFQLSDRDTCQSSPVLHGQTDSKGETLSPYLDTGVGEVHLNLRYQAYLHTHAHTSNL